MVAALGILVSSVTSTLVAEKQFNPGLVKHKEKRTASRHPPGRNSHDVQARSYRM